MRVGAGMRIAAFAVALLLAAGAGAGIGAVVGPDPGDPPPASGTDHGM